MFADFGGSFVKLCNDTYISKINELRYDGCCFQISDAAYEQNQDAFHRLRVVLHGNPINETTFETTEEFPFIYSDSGFYKLIDGKQCYSKIDDFIFESIYDSGNATVVLSSVDSECRSIFLNTFHVIDVSQNCLISKMENVELETWKSKMFCL